MSEDFGPLSATRDPEETDPWLFAILRCNAESATKSDERKVDWRGPESLELDERKVPPLFRVPKTLTEKTFL